jgi:hypothetical protein
MLCLQSPSRAAPLPTRRRFQPGRRRSWVRPADPVFRRCSVLGRRHALSRFVPAPRPQGPAQGGAATFGASAVGTGAPPPARGGRPRLPERRFTSILDGAPAAVLAGGVRGGGRWASRCLAPLPRGRAGHDRRCLHLLTRPPGLTDLLASVFRVRRVAVRGAEVRRHCRPLPCRRMPFPRRVDAGWPRRSPVVTLGSRRARGRAPSCSAPAAAPESARRGGCHSRPPPPPVAPRARPGCSLPVPRCWTHRLAHPHCPRPPPAEPRNRDGPTTTRLVATPAGP